ncbi:MAG: response regulator transcription factor [Burkholderiales bacterium]|nr:response regulator transcription factor [Burkholderiales bacterium]
MTTILIADDHVLVRDALKLLLSMQPGWEVVAETGDGAEVEQLVRQTLPDLLLLDLDLPNCRGEKIAASIRARFDAVKILIITGSLHPESVQRALAAGADGYVVKHGDSTELIHAVEAVIAGKQYVSQGIASLFAHQSNAQAFPGDSVEPVTPREQEIMCMIASGLSNEEIAAALNRSVLTVRKHRQNLMDKLGLRNAAEVTAFAIKHGFYQPL